MENELRITRFGTSYFAIIEKPGSVRNKKNVLFIITSIIQELKFLLTQYIA